MFDSIISVGIALGLPTAATGFFFWLMQRRVIKREKKREQALALEKAQKAEREKRQEDMQMLMMQSLRACTVLCEATARAVQRIPTAKCNGDMTAALKQVEHIQNEQKEYVMRLGLQTIYEQTGV